MKKVGHAGTLDPLATGVLILCIGGATRLSEYVMHQTKIYRASVKLGETTTTYDAEGDVVEEKEPSSITQADVAAVLPAFTGDIEQYPPMYSAIKQGGRKLYELAREGKTVERKARHVRIDTLDIVEWQSPEFVLDVTCSSGTYIRQPCTRHRGRTRHRCIFIRAGCALAAGSLHWKTQSRSIQLQETETPSDFLISSTRCADGLSDCHPECGRYC